MVTDGTLGKPNHMRCIEIVGNVTPSEQTASSQTFQCTGNITVLSRHMNMTALANQMVGITALSRQGRYHRRHHSRLRHLSRIGRLHLSRRNNEQMGRAKTDKIKSRTNRKGNIKLFHLQRTAWIDAKDDASPTSRRER